MSSLNKPYGVGVAPRPKQPATHAPHPPPTAMKQAVEARIPHGPASTVPRGRHKSLAASQAQEMQPKMQPTADSKPALTVGVLLRLIINEITTKMVKDLRQTIFIAFTSS